MKKNKNGFTLIELLVVIAIIGLLSTLSILALNQARARARDARRVADVSQMRTALEMYYNDNANYPDTPSTTPGAAITGASSAIYLRVIPTPPTPVDGSTCPAAQPAYTYVRTVAGTTGSASYTITYCLGSAVNTITGNILQTASPAGMTN